MSWPTALLTNPRLNLTQIPNPHSHSYNSVCGGRLYHLVTKHRHLRGTPGLLSGQVTLALTREGGAVRCVVFHVPRVVSPPMARIRPLTDGSWGALSPIPNHLFGPWSSYSVGDSGQVTVQIGSRNLVVPELQAGEHSDLDVARDDGGQ